MERKAFTISRATWWRGQSAVGSKLLLLNVKRSGMPEEATGKMCCLGSIALQCGATEADIADCESPARLANNGVSLAAFAPLVKPDFSGMGFANTQVARDMMQVNDNADLTDADRELQLTILAATIGWDLTFVD